MEFEVISGKTHVRSISLDEIAERYGTPFYFYDVDEVEERIQSVRRVLDNCVEILYAVKANSNIELLKAMRGKVDGLDIASAGEMKQSLLAGHEPRNMSFAGPGKTIHEIQEALEKRVGIMSVESVNELRDVCRAARKLQVRQDVILRINPKMLTKEFAVKMGGKASQFGIDEEKINPVMSIVKENEDVIHFRGIHVYSGTQCLNADAVAENIRNTLQIASLTGEMYGSACEIINVGGGFGVAYGDADKDLDLSLLAKLINEAIEGYKKTSGTVPRIFLELGRYIVAAAGLYVARIVREKESRDETFYILDGGMNHHLAASGNLGAMLRKNFRIVNLSSDNPERVECNLVGPLCTPLDLMGKKVSLAKPRTGDLVGFMNSGGYGYTASPHLFLSHDTPAELILRDGQIICARRRRNVTDFN